MRSTGCKREQLFVVIFLLLFANASINSWSHSVWKQRNEPGPWTVALYHCDDEEVGEGQVITSADGNPDLDLIVGPPGGDPLESTTDVRHGFLLRSIAGHSPQQCVAKGFVQHPLGDMSIELWLRFIEYGADIQVGLLEGVSLRVRIGGEGDRFQLMGANSEILEATAYSAPGFKSFPPVGDWHHYGVTIEAPNVVQTGEGNYQYGEGCVARFFYVSHIVGFVGQTKLDLKGLEFEPKARPAITVYQGSLAFDEFMISNVDWSDPVGHGGLGHGGVSVGHAFENGRQPPVGIFDWSLY